MNGVDGFPVPGHLMKQERIRQRMTQAELAVILGTTRSMVARMEKSNHGFNSVVTRRKVAQALGISAAAFGLISPEEVNHKTLYDVSLLRKTLDLHRELYFSGGETGGTKSILSITQTIHGISVDLNHKDREVLQVLCGYHQLGIDLAREEADYKLGEYFSRNAINIAKSLNDQILMASTLVRQCALFWEKGDSRTAAVAENTLSHTQKVPSSVVFGIYTHAPRQFAGNSRAGGFFQRAYDLARSSSPKDDDPGYIKPSPAFAQIWIAHGLIESEEYEEALNILDKATSSEDPKYRRRSCLIKGLQAKALFGTKEYIQAALVTHSGIEIAKDIHSAPNLKTLTGVYKQLQESPIGNSKEVRHIAAIL